MTTDTTAQLPTTIREFLAVHIAQDAEASARFFTDDAVLVDQGQTVRGRAEVQEFLATAGTEFTYTTDVRDAHEVDADHWVVLLHLEGDFPGGVADLDYRFSLSGGLIEELVVANH